MVLNKYNHCMPTILLKHHGMEPRYAFLKDLTNLLLFYISLLKPLQVKMRVVWSKNSNLLFPKKIKLKFCSILLPFYKMQEISNLLVIPNLYQKYLGKHLSISGKTHLIGQIILKILISFGAEYRNLYFNMESLII